MCMLVGKNPYEHYPKFNLSLNNARFFIIIFCISLDSSPSNPFSLTHNGSENDSQFEFNLISLLQLMINYQF